MRNYKTPLQRRHFEMIAATLKASKPLNDDDMPLWREMAFAFMSACKQSNGRFDSNRFRRACGMED